MRQKRPVARVGQKTRDERAEILARNLKTFRHEMGMTQVDLAAATGLGVDSVRCYEQARRLPERDPCIALARELGRSFNDLFDPNPRPIDPSRRPLFHVHVTGKISDESRKKLERFVAELREAERRLR